MLLLPVREDSYFASMLHDFHFSGPPNATVCRVVKATESSFEVIYDRVTFATRYIIEIKNSTYIKNYTTDDLRFEISDDVTIGSIYDVRVATENPFGTGIYSPAKLTSRKLCLSLITTVTS